MTNETDQLLAADLVVGSRAPSLDSERKERRRRKRLPSLSTLIRQATEAGSPPTGANITADGVVLTFGERASHDPDSPEAADELRKLI